MQKLVADNFTPVNRFVMMGFSSGTSNWLNFVMVNQTIVDQVFSIGANIGSLPNAYRWRAALTDKNLGSPDFMTRLTPEETTSIVFLLNPYEGTVFDDYSKFQAVDYSHVHFRMYFGHEDQFFGTESPTWQNITALLSPKGISVPTTLEGTMQGLKARFGCNSSQQTPVTSLAGSALTIYNEVFNCDDTKVKSFESFVYGNTANWPATTIGSLAGYAVRASHAPLFPPPSVNALPGDYTNGFYIIAYLSEMVADFLNFQQL